MCEKLKIYNEPASVSEPRTRHTHRTRTDDLLKPRLTKTQSAAAFVAIVQVVAVCIQTHIHWRASFASAVVHGALRQYRNQLKSYNASATEQ